MKKVVYLLLSVYAVAVSFAPQALIAEEFVPASQLITGQSGVDEDTEETATPITGASVAKPANSDAERLAQCESDVANNNSLTISVLNGRTCAEMLNHSSEGQAE